MSVAAVVLAVLIWSPVPRAQSKRFITESDLFKFTWIADPQVSPDGSTVAFVRVTVNEKENRYETSLFTVPTSGSETPRRLTSGIRDTTPRWAPDGKQLLFVRAPDKDGKPQPPQLFVLDTAGGEARQITDVARGAGGPMWSPDGKSIAFTSSTGPAEPTGDGHHTDVKVITKAVYRANGNPGWLDTEHHSHIFMMRAPADAADKAIPEQITDGEFDEGGITWSPDSSKIYFTSIRSAEPYYDEAG
ncbi:MAG TPA: hypothetical protein VFA59_21075, partial [Vicinamibacterales bacterium]|nr:hypothetical protein [Vicinamibacterales bacterium]